MLVSGLDWSPVTDLLVSCSHDRSAFVWKYESAYRQWKPSLVVLRVIRAAINVKWSPNGMCVVASQRWDNPEEQSTLKLVPFDLFSLQVKSLLSAAAQSVCLYATTRLRKTGGSVRSSRSTSPREYPLFPTLFLLSERVVPTDLSC